MSKKIKLTKGKYTIVDDADYEILNRFKWTYLSTGYAYRQDCNNGKTTSIVMHRIILNAPVGMKVDHINGNGLDNRRCNLRLATHSQNLHNTRKTKSKFGKGVTYTRGRFHARIMVNRILYRLGSFSTSEEASQAYNKAAKKLLGEFSGTD